MSSTLDDRLKLGYERALDEARAVLVEVCTVVLHGVPVKDKLKGLTNGEKKRLGFNKDQVSQIENGLALVNMDITLLNTIISAFGGLGPCPLKDWVKEVKDARNTFYHEKQSVTFDKPTLKSKLTHLSALCISILEELKGHSDPTHRTFLDNHKTKIKDEFLKLENVMEDILEENTNNLVQSATVVTKLIRGISVETKSFQIAASELKQATTDASKILQSFPSDLPKEIDERTLELGKTTTEIRQAAANASTILNSSADIQIKIEERTRELEKVTSKITHVSHTAMKTIEESTHELVKEAKEVYTKNRDILDEASEITHSIREQVQEQKKQNVISKKKKVVISISIFMVILVMAVVIGTWVYVKRCEIVHKGILSGSGKECYVLYNDKARDWIKAKRKCEEKESKEFAEPSLASDEEVINLRNKIRMKYGRSGTVEGFKVWLSARGNGSSMVWSSSGRTLSSNSTLWMPHEPIAVSSDWCLVMTTSKQMVQLNPGKAYKLRHCSLAYFESHPHFALCQVPM